MRPGVDPPIGPGLKPYLIEADIGPPGQAQEFHRAHLARSGKPSGEFETIGSISQRFCGKDQSPEEAVKPGLSSSRRKRGSPRTESHWGSILKIARE